MPRAAGGSPWPPHGVLAGAAVSEGAAAVTGAAAVAAAGEPAPATGASAATSPVGKHADVPTSNDAAQPNAAGAVADAEAVGVTDGAGAESSPLAGAAGAAAASIVNTGPPLRQGLPRVAGGDPWPAAGRAPAQAGSAASAATSAAVSPAPAAPAAATAPAVAAPVAAAQPAAQTPVATAAATTTAPAPAPAQPKPATATPAKLAAAPATQPQAAQAKTAQPQTAQAPAQPASPAAKAAPRVDPAVIRIIRRVALIVIGSIAAAGILVLAARGVTTLPGVPEFLTRYPGEYHLPETTEPGFPAWARWTHFLNFFLMVLIIRSGLLVRHQAKPPAFWTPKKGGKKISINLWLHTSLDVLWMLNGLVFVVLLFASGHWVRIVPTSWEVFPNALSAALQYATLNWPVENGWVNYNSLQQIMYFLVVFVAAPLAVITGLRMSEWWPEKAERLNKLYPAPVARAIHFPTMLFFVFFIVVHVILVFSTGALRNLNHMYAGTDVVNWAGFWYFVLAIAVTAGGWVAARPLIIAPIANLFGKVSNR
nr:cytochrome b/b6 domain-containing protein [Leucobacter exalbidus]